MKRVSVLCVWLVMDGQTPGHQTGHETRQMTVAEASLHFGVTDKTIRRWIKNKRVDARKNGSGQWAIVVETKPSDTDQSNVQPDENGSAPLVDQMQSEIAHLRDQFSHRDRQIDQLSQLLAMSQQQNTALTQQLPAPRQSVFSKLKESLWEFYRGRYPLA